MRPYPRVGELESIERILAEGLPDDLVGAVRADCRWDRDGSVAAGWGARASIRLDAGFEIWAS